jgi:hypothetical protein
MPPRTISAPGQSNALVLALLPPHDPEGESETDSRAASDVEDPDAPGPAWAEADFSPFFTPSESDLYFSDGGVTFRRTPKGPVVVSGFVPELLGETMVVTDLDEPGAPLLHTVSVRFTTPAGDSTVVDVRLDPGANLSSALVDAAPGGMARLSVARRQDVGPAAVAFASPTFTSRTMFGQTGWRDDGFGLPGDESVTMTVLGRSPGLALLGVPGRPDSVAVGRGLAVLLRICCCAPRSVVLPLIALVFAAPMFRGEEHLAARAFLLLLAGPSQIGKTLLATRILSLLGRFWAPPGCVATWRSTPTTIETYLHVLRDLCVGLDNLRAADGDATETFRQIVIAMGDGIGRARSSWSHAGARVVGASRFNSLVLATGEHGVEGDAAVNGRMIEIEAKGIDRNALLDLAPEELGTLAHVFSAFVSHLAAQSPAWWHARRAGLRELGRTLTEKGDARTSEHLATLGIAFATFVEFVADVGATTAPQWIELARAFYEDLPALAVEQARRVRDDRLDEVVLREVARAVRDGSARLEPLGRPPAGAQRGLLLGAFDADSIYLIPDSLTRWARDQLRGARGMSRFLGRKQLGWSLQARGGGDGQRTQKTFGGKRHGVWQVRRRGLQGEWDGLLDLIPERRGAGASDAEEA